jgi:undecaprenyl-diphosphatase
MNIFQAIFLGVVQGLTEFLPVSSSGHLVLLQKILGINEPTLAFDTCLHIGTLVAVMFFFWKDIFAILKKPFQKLTWLLIAATIPTAVIGFAFKDFFEQAFSSGKTLGIEFIATGLILFFAEKISIGRKDVREASYFDAIFIGILQGVAILPAVSRSGLTISGSLFRDFNKDFAARFSFLLSIPAILGAALLQTKDLLHSGSGIGNISMSALTLGTLASAVVGYLSIGFMISLLKKGKMRYFSYYVFIIGGLVIVDQLATHFFF